jgi:hypothetical protein
MNENTNMSQDEINQLADWCDEQREAYHSGNLSQDKIDKLNSVGFDWNFDSCDKTINN